MKLKYIFARTRSKENVVSTHIHDGIEIVYYINGDGAFSIEGNQYEYKNGTFCVIGKGSKHSEHAYSSTDLIFAVFEGTVNLREGVYNDAGEKILSLLFEIQEEFTNHTPESVEILDHYFNILRLKLERMNAEYIKIEAGDNPILESAFTYIMEYFNTDIDFEHLAHSVGYSYDRFRHIFKDKFGVPIKKMILKKRIDNAKIQLCTTSKSIEEIARDNGYKSLSVFCTVFKKSQGVSPGQYRKSRKAKTTVI